MTSLLKLGPTRTERAVCEQKLYRYTPSIILQVSLSLSAPRPFNPTSAAWVEEQRWAAPRQRRRLVPSTSTRSRGWCPAWLVWGRRRSRSRSLWRCCPGRGRASRSACNEGDETHFCLKHSHQQLDTILREDLITARISPHTHSLLSAGTLDSAAPLSFSSVFVSSAWWLKAALMA